MISRRRRASSSVPKTYRRGCGALLNAIDCLYAELCSVVEVGDLCRSGVTTLRPYQGRNQCVRF